MNVLMISRDPLLADPHSAVRKRVGSYATQVEELHVFVVGVRLPRRAEALSSTLLLLMGGPFAALTYDPGIRIDLVTAQDPFETGFLGWLIARRLGAALELQVHTDIASPWFARVSWKQRIRVALARFLLPRASCVRVVSERVAAGVRLLAPRQRGVSVLPIRATVPEHGVLSENERSEIRALLPSVRTVVVSAARFAPEKALPLLLAAFARVASRSPEVGLLLAGDGPLRASLEDEVRRLELTDRVVFVGWVSDVSRYYAAADLVMSGSLFEGYGLSRVEAGLLGTPLVSSDVGAVGAEIPREYVWSFPPGDEEACAAALGAAVANPAQRMAKAIRLREHLLSRLSSPAQYESSIAAAWHACVAPLP